ncbi:hypothetical protein TSTA_050390 [Talaromyces stipitatus ATCC 10500]|uniref:Uncharacterized protein n=1 Tax=Talaromyces stipitatus (strain ATCC 10500 / CBS 375.48 / QM 6759 / NRRL 1006) TaxID=441959 RepID=B8MIT8_TALSN|nr:uncharacterized protein TSTA_050390 [Talaromyces stipitatus ATCC 10500]EED15600.1 hypothetical protein TSTA_050390 [Talaromyces stipitatus ATCC 10500]
MRHYLSMSKDPESDDLLAKPANEKADETIVYNMAALAQKLGFTPPAQCLLKARKPDSYEYSTDDFEQSIRRIVEVLHCGHAM